ncbi:MAG: mechanosensitive ion channel family protein [Methylophilaceae bacterium]|nr:mechanosensitive ion channel family protein [Methylophilaceae bacterium]
MDHMMKSLAAFGLNELWIIKIVGVSIATLLLHFIVAFVFRKLIKASKMTSSFWDDTFVVSASKPLPMVIWIVGISIVLKVIGNQTESEFFELTPIIRDAAIAIAFAWFFWRLITEASYRYLVQQQSRGETIDRTTIDALSKLGHLIVFVGTMLTLMQTLGFSVSGLLAAGGIGGIAIGFAAKDILANFFGGLTIYTDRPFIVGDWIRSPDKDIEGTVEKISWRYTQIRRFNKNPIYVPNSIFTTIVVENPSRMTNRRIKETIGIRYQDIHLMAGIVTEVKAMLQNHADIDTSKTLIVNFNAFNASSVDFFIYTFSHTTVWEAFHVVKQDVLLKIAAIIHQHGAEIAFPTQTLHISREDSPH